MSPNQQLKREAKFQLRGHWPQALAVTAVYLTATLFFAVLQEGLLVLTGVIPLKAALGEIQIAQLPHPPLTFIINSVVTVFRLVLLAPLVLGIVKWFFRRAQGEEISVSVLFEYYSSGEQFVRALAFLAHGLVRVLAWGCVSFLPGGLCLAAAAYQRRSFAHYAAAGVLEPLGLVFLGLGILLFIPMMLRLFLAPFLFVEDSSLSAGMCFRLSVQKMRFFRGHLFSLICSFLGWLVLCLFSFPLLYVFPYFAAALSNSAKWILFENHRAEEANAYYREQTQSWGRPM